MKAREDVDLFNNFRETEKKKLRLETEVEELQRHLEEAQRDLQDALTEKEILQDKVEELEFNNNEIVDFKMPSGAYHPNFVNCIWQLQARHVAIANINSVISACLALVGKKMEQLPCQNTLMKMSVSRLSASQQQLEVNKNNAVTFQTCVNSKIRWMIRSCSTFCGWPTPPSQLAG
jgi:chromosome segregation ATPase